MNEKPQDYGIECYCYRLRSITAQVTKMYDKYLKETGITCQQFSTLEHIRALEPVSVTALAKMMGLDRTSLSRNLKLLKENLMIEDEAGHGRSRSIVLSKQGKEILDQAEKQWEKAQTTLEDIIGVEQLQYLKEMENKLCELSS
jgi:DNA-binding MarR family transcriptional regulator